MQKNIKEKSKFNLNSVSSPLSNAVATTGVNGGFSVLASISKKAIAIIIMVVIVASGLFIANIQSASAANAGPFEDWTCDTYKSGLGEDYGDGTTGTNPEISLVSTFGLISDANNQEKMTAYEVYGTAGLNFTMWHSVDREDLADNEGITIKYATGSESRSLSVPNSSPYWSENFMECTGANGAIGNGIANFLFTGTKIGVTVINFVYGVATDSSVLVVPLYASIESMVKALNDSIYTPFITLIIMIGALWMAYIGLVKKKSTEAFQGALWMIGAAIAGALLFINPLFITSTASSIVSAFTQGISQAITSNSASGVGQSLCSVDEDTLVPEDSTKILVSKESRTMQCAIWYNILYTPWIVGQFGASPSSSTAKDVAIMTGKNDDTRALVENIPIKLGSNTNLSTDEKSWPLIQLNAQALSTNITDISSVESQTQYIRGSQAAVAYQQLAVNNYGSTWKGMDPFPRVTTAGTSLIAMTATGILVIVFGVSIMVYEISTIFLLLIMPFFLLIGVHPGMGRRIAMRWVEMIVNLTIKRIMASAMLAIFIALYGVIMTTPNTIWFAQNVMVVLITIVGLKYKNKLLNMFADVDFGGDKNSLSTKGDAPGFGKKLLGAAVGAGVATMAAGSTLNQLAPTATAKLTTPTVPPVAPTGNAGPTIQPSGGGTGPTVAPTGNAGGRTVAPTGNDGGRTVQPTGTNGGARTAAPTGTAGPTVQPSGGRTIPVPVPTGNAGNGGRTVPINGSREANPTANNDQKVVEPGGYYTDGWKSVGPNTQPPRPDNGGRKASDRILPNSAASENLAQEPINSMGQTVGLPEEDGYDVTDPNYLPQEKYSDVISSYNRDEDDGSYDITDPYSRPYSDAPTEVLSPESYGTADTTVIPVSEASTPEQPVNATLPSRTSSEEDAAIDAARQAETAKRVEDLRKKTLRNAALQGASQGFTSGAKGAILGATMTGLTMGDNAHDNEVNRQEHEKRDDRETKRANREREQMDAQNKARQELTDAQIEANEIRRQEILAEEKRRREEHNERIIREAREKKEAAEKAKNDLYEAERQKRKALNPHQPRPRPGHRPPL